MASALSQGRVLQGCIWRYRAEGNEEVRPQRVCAPGKKQKDNRTPASKALRVAGAGIARFEEEDRRSEKDETTLAAGSQGGGGAAAGALARSAVVPRTRPAREAASKPKTYVEDSDGLDEEEDEDDAFVGEEEEEEEEEEEDVQIRSKRGRSRVG